ncbi:accessory gland-specific peptide 95EF [Drosophila teissieri]|uniref:accessory gland-specific peptide 95EF n=1 Tax=Drosophila teissieri TaxID=7243 RepID=UPI001CBA3C68|nr:accessory gland-specific peptide 95EF [Drosophila teissieri]
MASVKLLLIAILVVAVSVNTSAQLLSQMISPIVDAATNFLVPTTNSSKEIPSDSNSTNPRFEAKNRELSPSSLKSIAG